MAPAKKAQKFYAIHGTPKIYTKWIGPGGAQERTAGHSRLTFHGFLERAAAEYYLTIPNAAAAQEWANAHGKSKQWREHAPPIVPTVDHSDLPPFKEFLQFCPGLTEAPPPQLPTPPPSTPGDSPPPSEFGTDTEYDTNYDVLFTSDLIAEARQRLMQLCVSIATTQLGPDKDLGKLSLL